MTINKYPNNLESTIKIIFKDKSLLNNVFIHRSYLNEHKSSSLPSNERLEFLGARSVCALSVGGENSG